MKDAHLAPKDIDEVVVSGQGGRKGVLEAGELRHGPARGRG